MPRELGIQFDVGYFADVNLQSGVGVIPGAHENSVKLPTADGQRIVGVVMYDVLAGEQVTLRKGGIAEIKTSGAFSAGDELMVSATTGVFKRAVADLGEALGGMHCIAAIAEESNGASDTKGYASLVSDTKWLIGDLATVVPIHAEAANPSSSDDDYAEGSFWYNTVTGGLFQCLDNTESTAVWIEITNPGVVRAGETYTSADANPGVNHDGVDTASLGKKFAVGAFWTNAATDALWVCLDVSTGAAVWVEVINNSVVRAGETYTSADANPGVNHDGVDTASLGKKFAVGAFWTNAATDALWVCLDVSTGAAVWVEVINNSVVRAGEMYTKAGDPGVNHDGVDTATEGTAFAVGALWLNTSDGGLFWCTDASTGAAAWSEVTAVG